MAVLGTEDVAAVSAVVFALGDREPDGAVSAGERRLVAPPVVRRPCWTRDVIP